MSIFTDAINAESLRPNKGPACAVTKVREQLQGDDLADFDALLAAVETGERTAASVHRILARVGIKLHPERIRYHQRGFCKCEAP